MFHYTIYLVFLLPLNVLSQPSPNVNVTLGSSLTARRNGNNSWTSPSQEFAFGFIQPGSGTGYLLAIWFNKISEKTVIWSANRNTLVPEGSTIQLLQGGRFVLNDPTGQNIWEANFTGGAGVAYGAMLDTGNFVLASDTSISLWQSFDTPTDTLLPTQMLIENQSLVSSLSGTNYSSGKFQLILQDDGNLVAYTIHDRLPAQPNFAYWSLQSFGKDFQFVFNQSGLISLIAKNGSLINSVFSLAVPLNKYYQRLTLDYDGVIRHYVYPKSSNSTGGWPIAWSILEFEPSNICMRINQDIGGGLCGYNSLCSFGGTTNTNQKPVCQCPLGYSFIDPNDSMSGCKPDFMPQSCDNKLNETGVFGYNDMLNTDWPLSNFELFESVTEDWCRQVCLNDCFCAAVIYRDSNCWKKRFPLSNGRTDSSVGGKALIKVRHGNSTISHTKRWSINKVVIIVGSVLLGSSLIVHMLVLLRTLFFGSWFKKKVTHVTANPVLSGLNIRNFSYHELEEATNGFTEELGRGACSIVYKGTLKHEGMQLVAVKKLQNMVNEGDREFIAEVSSISRTNHKNLVQLLGYCNEGQHRLLVYEFMCNGSLAAFLFGNPKPDWYKRVKIAITTARGLCYLHEECSSQIIHCDIKPQNVLLDESLTAKISDFGLAKLLKQDQTKTMTMIRGTRGYVAPEWYKNMAITSKVDVYSFGILLLELVCCRNNIDTNVRDEQEVILSDWAYDCYDERKLHMLIAFDVEALNDFNRVEKLVCIALWCIQEDPSLRPSMKRVVQMVEGSISVSVPPNPSSFTIIE